MTALLDELERDNPNVRSIMAAALGNVRPTHLHDRDVLAAWMARPAGVRPDPAPAPRPKHAAAEPVASSEGVRLPILAE